MSHLVPAAGQQLHPAREAQRVTLPPSPRNSSHRKVSLGRAIQQAKSLEPPLCQVGIRLEINIWTLHLLPLENKEPKNPQPTRISQQLALWMLTDNKPLLLSYPKSPQLPLAATTARCQVCVFLQIMWKTWVLWGGCFSLSLPAEIRTPENGY